MLHIDGQHSPMSHGVGAATDLSNTASPRDHVDEQVPRRDLRGNGGHFRDGVNLLPELGPDALRLGRPFPKEAVERHDDINCITLLFGEARADSGLVEKTLKVVPVARGGGLCEGQLLWQPQLYSVGSVRVIQRQDPTHLDFRVLIAHNDIQPQLLLASPFSGHDGEDELDHRFNIGSRGAWNDFGHRWGKTVGSVQESDDGGKNLKNARRSVLPVMNVASCAADIPSRLGRRLP